METLSILFALDGWMYQWPNLLLYRFKMGIQTAPIDWRNNKNNTDRLGRHYVKSEYKLYFEYINTSYAVKKCKN